MANIGITNYCNLKCPYCFAEDFKADEPRNMSLDEFKEGLNFIQGYEPVKILGGEPTLHPQFKNILSETFKHCLVYNSHCTIFTNGANLKQYLPLIDQYSFFMSVLINCNSPQYQSIKDYNNLLNLIDYIYTNEKYRTFTELGCTIHLLCKNYDFLWDILKKYNIKLLRISVASPGGVYTNNRNSKDEYYQELKTMFLDFTKVAEQNNVMLSFDCNQIPRCYFTADELEFIDKNSENHRPEWCEPTIDILMDHQVIPCFGNYHPTDYTEFDDTYELRRYFTFKTNYDATVQNDDGKCASCKQFKHFQCQGGCLAFSKINRTSSD